MYLLSIKVCLFKMRRVTKKFNQIFSNIHKQYQDECCLQLELQKISDTFACEQNSLESKGIYNNLYNILRNIFKHKQI